MSDNQRQAFRFRLPANKQAAKLSLGGETIHVRLMDHSATGFSLLAPVHRMITSDSPLRLETTTATYEVRVINVEEENGKYRLGLAVVREIADSRKQMVSSPVWPFAGQNDHRRVPRVLPITLGLVAAGVMLISTLGLDLFKSVPGPTLDKNLSLGETAASAGADSSAVRHPRSVKATPASRVNPELQQRFDQLGAAVFMMPDVAKKLELTPQQIKNIARIVQKTAAAESQFASSANDGKANLARSRDLLRQSREEARSVLNADQAKQWDALIGSE